MAGFFTFVRENSVAQGFIWLTVALMLAAVGLYVVLRIRGRWRANDFSANELISDFRELHSKGDLSDEEFRTIKTSLRTELGRELKGTEKKG